MEAIGLSDFDYVPECDRALKEGKQTVFTLGVLTFEQETWLSNQSSLGVPAGDQIENILTMGLKGVKNFSIEGKEIKAERSKEHKSEVPGNIRPWKDRFLSRIPHRVRDELALEIRTGKGKEIGESELKNS